MTHNIIPENKPARPAFIAAQTYNVANANGSSTRVLEVSPQVAAHAFTAIFPDDNENRENTKPSSTDNTLPYQTTCTSLLTRNTGAEISFRKSTA